MLNASQRKLLPLLALAVVITVTAGVLAARPGGPAGLMGTAAAYALASDPDAVAPSSGRLKIIARGTDNAIWRRSYAGGAWGAWQSLGRNSSLGPAVASQASGKLNVFAGSSDRQLMVRSVENGVWTEWTPLGGVITSGPAAVSWRDGRVDVFARGGDNGLWQRT